VQSAIEHTATPPLMLVPRNQPVEEAYADTDQPIPPSDPLGEVSPRKSKDFTFAAAANNLWKVFLEGEKAQKALEGWQKASTSLRPHMSQILDWLERFVGGTGGNPSG
jgi:hypothetical protein